ncbi:MAG: DUF1566 domain-containing protein [bacterium]
MKKGFTLIELLVVILIVGILASLAAINLNNVRSKSRDTKRVSDIRQIQTALETYINDLNVYPSAITSGNSLIGDNGITYMTEVPSTPGNADGDCVTDIYSYSSSSPYNTYKLYYCLGGAVEDAGPTGCIAKPEEFCGSPAVGESYEGGIVVHIFESGDSGYVAGETHGIISALSDVTTYPGDQVAWTNASNVLLGTSTAIGTGQANTNLIINQSGHTISGAKRCNDATTNGYSDWYLPSKATLAEIYALRATIGNFSNYYYWSSSENASYDAWCLHFQNGTFVELSKTAQTNLVRCVRSF